MRVGRRWKGLAAAACVVVTGAPALAAGRAVTLASLDGTALAGQLYEASPRPAPGVVLVPMLGRTRADWDEIAQQLEAGGITVLAVDIRGHGGSGGSTSSPVTSTARRPAAAPTCSANAVTPGRSATSDDDPQDWHTTGRSRPQRAQCSTPSRVWLTAAWHRSHRWSARHDRQANRRARPGAFRTQTTTPSGSWR